MGRLGAIGILGLVGHYVWKFIRAKKTPVVILAGTGLVIFMANMTIHFPTRCPQTVIVLLTFMAFYEKVVCSSNEESGYELSG